MIWDFILFIPFMTKSLNVKFENGVRFLVQHFPPSDESSRKPILFHDIRVGVYLYNNGYSEDVVLAGLLHDALEWSSATDDVVRDEFGENVLKLVLANTKDDTIKDKRYCPICGENVEVNDIEISYAFKLILDEFKSLGIYPKLVLKQRFV